MLVCLSAAEKRNQDDSHDHMQAGKEAQRVADEAAATGHSTLMALQQKQEAIGADMQTAAREQERWRAQWEAKKQDLQQEHDTLQHSIQVIHMSSSEPAST